MKKGYSRKVPENLINQPQQPLWYLPHHPNKPDKVRVVFDCAAKYRGTSLNDQLLQGPDLTNSLVGVLLRFRENPVALMADIEGMFDQVRTTPNDYDALRFLWWPNNDPNTEPDEYQMLVHLFGTTSSPSCANFALRKTAEDNANDFVPSIVDIVKKNFYVDDCLKSVSDEQEGVEVARKLPELLSRGGFRLTKWVSNSAAVIESIPESERAGDVRDMNFVQSTIQQALGKNWDVVTDTFKVTIKKKPPTRRGLLSIVSSIYDPLGLVAPFILPAKILMQELCRENLSWDDPIPDRYLERWNVWINELPEIENFRVSRCIKPATLKEIASTQLHTFADASERGYGAISYVRFEDVEGKIYCSFMIAKSRVAPLKKTTIPRMELSAAVCAAKLEKLVRKETDLDLKSSILWTDSTCVLGYLNNTTKRFQTFVANRVAAIRETTELNQWKHIPGDQNPADDVSRGLSANEMLNCKRWKNGPQFLWKPEDCWPTQPSTTLSIGDDDPEVKSNVQAFSVNCQSESTMDEIIKRFSLWQRLKRFIVWMLRYRTTLIRRINERKDGDTCTKSPAKRIKPLTVDEIEDAEKNIIRYVQERSYRKELSALRNSQSNRSPTEVNDDTVQKTSPICKLDPQLSDKLLRVGGRLRNAPILEERKHQIIIPKESTVAKLLARHYHEIAGHSGLEHVLAMIRERY